MKVVENPCELSILNTSHLFVSTGTCELRKTLWPVDCHFWTFILNLNKPYKSAYNKFTVSMHSFLQAFAGNIKNELEKFPETVRHQVVLLFSAHSLPMTVRITVLLDYMDFCVDKWSNREWNLSHSVTGCEQRRSLSCRGSCNCTCCDGKTAIL